MDGYDRCGRQILAPDGGWGWMVVLGAAISQFVFGSLARSSGVIYLVLLDRYKASAVVTSWCMAMNWVLWCALGPITAAVMNKYGIRVASIIGAMATSIGIVASGFAPNMVALYFTFGICVGVGLSFIYTPPQAMVSHYFTKKKAKALALATAGSSVSAFCTHPLFEYLFSTYGYTGGMLLFGSIALHLCVSVALFRPLKNYIAIVIEVNGPQESAGVLAKSSTDGSMDNMNDYTIDNIAEVAENKQKVHMIVQDNLTDNAKATNDIKLYKSSLKSQKQGTRVLSGNCSSIDGALNEHSRKNQSLHWSILRAPSFWYMCGLSFAGHMTNNGSIHLIPALKVDQGIDRTRSVWLLSVLGISDLFIRVPIGILLDMKIFHNHPSRRLLFYIASVFLSGCVDILTPLCNDYSGLVFLSILRGASCSIFYAQRATILCDQFGAQQVSSALGFTLIPMGIGGILSRVLGGVTKDHLHSYAPAFYIHGVLALGISGSYICYIVYLIIKDKIK